MALLAYACSPDKSPSAQSHTPSRHDLDLSLFAVCCSPACVCAIDSRCYSRNGLVNRPRHSREEGDLGREGERLVRRSNNWRRRKCWRRARNGGWLYVEVVMGCTVIQPLASVNPCVLLTLLNRGHTHTPHSLHNRRSVTPWAPRSARSALAPSCRP